MVEIPGHGYRDPAGLLGFIPLFDLFLIKLSDPREIFTIHLKMDSARSF
ncbi:MAG TPA: hypothetical protein VE573_02220 [Nitrososphaeraceae archaeon]|nr:hypothetical protein [Nitrososphaeraceae archaeon]